MLIHGGLHSSGVACTCSVCGSYWMQLHQLVAVHHLARREGQVAADLEPAGVDLARPALVVDQVVEELLRALDQAAAAGVERPLERGRVGGQEVGRRHRVQHQVDEHRRPCARRPGPVRPRPRPHGRTGTPPGRPAGPRRRPGCPPRPGRRNGGPWGRPGPAARSRGRTSGSAATSGIWARSVASWDGGLHGASGFVNVARMAWVKASPKPGGVQVLEAGRTRARARWPRVRRPHRPKGDRVLR